MKRRKWNKFSQSSSQRIVAKMFMEIRENINSRRVGIVLPSPPFFQFSEQSPIFVADERFKNTRQREREKLKKKRERCLKSVETRDSNTGTIVKEFYETKRD